MHQTSENLLRSLYHFHPPQDLAGATGLISQILSIISHTLRSTVHTTLETSPGAGIFNRDMLLDNPYVANWIQLRNQRQQKIDWNLLLVVQ